MIINHTFIRKDKFVHPRIAEIFPHISINGKPGEFYTGNSFSEDKVIPKKLLRKKRGR